MKKELIKNMVSLIVGEALLEFIENPTSPNIVNDLREKYSEKILSAIDSMQEEPNSKFEKSIQEGDNIVYNEDLGCRVNLSQLNRVAKKEEPKKCMYTKDNYTDNDRKTLCDGCEEKCEYAQKEADWLQELHCKLDSLSKEDFEKVWAKYAQKEEPVSEEFKIALEKKVREAQDWTYIEEEGGECPLNEEFGACDLEEFARWGANWQKEQLMAKAVDGEYWDNNIILEGGIRGMYDDGEKVKVIVIKEE